MRQCKACNSAHRAELEDELARKVPHRLIGEHFGLSLDVIFRHSKHLGRSIIVKGDQPLVARVEALMARVESIATKAQSSKEWYAAVAALREVRFSLELIAKLTGQIVPAGQGVTVGVAVNLSTGHSASELNNRDLDVQIAMDVAEATGNFDPRTIEEMKRLVARNRPALTMDSAAS